MNVSADDPRPETFLLEDLSPETVADWRSIAVAEGSYFQTPDWVMSWWRHLTGQPRTTTAQWRDSSGALEAIAWMSEVNERLHPRVPLSLPLVVNAGSGLGAADHCGFPGSARRAGDVRAWIDTLGGTVRLQNLDPSQLFLADGWRRVGTTETFARPLAPDLAIVPSTSMAKDLRKRARRLEERDVTIEVVEGRGLTEEIVDALFRQHAERFDDLGIVSFFGPNRRPQLLELIEVSSERCGPVAAVARHGDSVVGVDLSFVCGTRMHNYQGGWSQEYRTESLGTQLIVAAMTWAQENAVTTFDFLRGSEQFKDRFGAELRTDESYERRVGLSGLAFAAKKQARDRLRKGA